MEKPIIYIFTKDHTIYETYYIFFDGAYVNFTEKGTSHALAIVSIDYMSTTC